eukprot:1169543-Pyramimonas_sp.AAC.1
MPVAYARVSWIFGLHEPEHNGGHDPTPERKRSCQTRMAHLAVERNKRKSTRPQDIQQQLETPSGPPPDPLWTSPGPLTGPLCANDGRRARTVRKIRPLHTLIPS